MTLTQDFIAFIWCRQAGLAGPVLQYIYAARDMKTLTSMVLARGLGPGEFVRYGRQAVQL